jgi:hypothetical protein
VDINRLSILLALTIVPSASQASQGLRTLHTFAGPPTDGAGPLGGMVRKDGVIYGTTESGGSGTGCGSLGCGTVYALSPPASSGEPWTEHLLYNFGGFSDGANPTSGVVFDPHGVLFGTTQSGGAGYGTVYSLTPPEPGGTWSMYCTPLAKTTTASIPPLHRLLGLEGRSLELPWPARYML